MPPPLWVSPLSLRPTSFGFNFSSEILIFFFFLVLFCSHPSIIRNCHGYKIITEIRTWWDALSTLDPDFGYFPNDRKCWIIAKPAKEESVGEAFKETSLNVTVQGQKHLGPAIGSREHLEEYVSKKVSSWINDIAKLAEFSPSQPQDLLETLENAISHASFLRCNQLDRNILALAVRLGGLGVGNPSLEGAKMPRLSK